MKLKNLAFVTSLLLSVLVLTTAGITGLTWEYHLSVDGLCWDPEHLETTSATPPEPLVITNAEATATNNTLDAYSYYSLDEISGKFWCGYAIAQLKFTPNRSADLQISFDYRLNSECEGWGDIELGYLPYCCSFTDMSYWYDGEKIGSYTNTVRVPYGSSFGIILNATTGDNCVDGNSHLSRLTNLIVTYMPVGDLDHNGDVDGSDLARFIVAYAGELLEADLNQNGYVEEGDLMSFVENFGASD